ncbi:hypothetical protein [Alicyclobacillus fodiniaquatilis]|jgi:hypothetical protein|uniref:Uncharacterized protein n=1 Tax=Alicyclobacillus fodiniaquatilis TaxID=1661150 RepID=A0ABW4JNI3_9BACL
MYVILSVTLTGSAEIAVNGGSSMDPHIVIADLLGMTIADALKRILPKGYKLKFVTDQFYVCYKSNHKRHKRHEHHKAIRR